MENHCFLVIGNGFDLARGYKTSYKDFVSDFIQKDKGLYQNESATKRL
ncbi:MAG: AbiH family protein [Culicoidibacterales bacterium]